MIGNDIIDLAQSRLESNWQRKGFIEKLFTTEEQEFIRNHSKPETMVWLLWSMKEAAYKIYNRQTKIREFCPKKLCCFLDSFNLNQAFGKVICNENVYYTKTTISPESIHTIAVNNLQNLNYVIEVENVEIIKDENGIPYSKTSNSLQDISISHHGRFEKWVMIQQ
ncbi:4'-phosphopantetheinyl transferase superfamily protein [Flavobacterium sp. DG2-3]|uniref:4'-phosphopantetheinyl transferase family protein n=1 Tax=Flavobacterium sp. DG2-3 TaxID=3068317 RepID=UPI00273E1238|nr:4'-phosphopantetheinyl transferase superfamily protein [Flavobacterium sp. DG2-3]MDP5199851.1 4'-phosphopantetheinyl transferase superfamily protein [Flavobacterium sp. DG2-3]